MVEDDEFVVRWANELRRARGARGGAFPDMKDGEERMRKEIGGV